MKEEKIWSEKWIQPTAVGFEDEKKLWAKEYRQPLNSESYLLATASKEMGFQSYHHTEVNCASNFKEQILSWSLPKEMQLCNNLILSWWHSCQNYNLQNWNNNKFLLFKLLKLMIIFCGSNRKLKHPPLSQILFLAFIMMHHGSTPISLNFSFTLIYSQSS
jgi:hypothetical protein